MNGNLCLCQFPSHGRSVPLGFVLPPYSAQFHNDYHVRATCAGEFEPHAGCWMGFPYDGNIWREDAKPAQQQYAGVARAISEFEPVTMWTDPEAMDVATEVFKGDDNVFVKELEINDGWTRDWGPSVRGY